MRVRWNFWVAWVVYFLFICCKYFALWYGSENWWLWPPQVPYNYILRVPWLRAFICVDSLFCSYIYYWTRSVPAIPLFFYVRYLQKFYFRSFRLFSLKTMQHLIFPLQSNCDSSSFLSIFALYTKAKNIFWLYYRLIYKMQLNFFTFFENY